MYSWWAARQLGRWASWTALTESALGFDCVDSTLLEAEMIHATHVLFVGMPVVHGHPWFASSLDSS